MNIAPMSVRHVRPVAALHMKTLTGLLHALGGAATRAFYSGCVDSPRTIAFVALEGDDVKGFVFGSLTPRALKIEALARKPLAVTAAVALGVILRPSAFRYLLEVARGSAGTHDAGAPELTYLAVAPDRQGVGVGRQLVRAFSAAVRKAGAQSYELSVDDENPGAAAFYKRLGFERTGHYREFGVDRQRYTLDIAKAPQ